MRPVAQPRQPPLVAERLPRVPRGATPLQLPGSLLRDRGVEAKAGQGPVQDRRVVLLGEHRREAYGTADPGNVPLARLRWNVVDRAVTPKDGRRRLRAPARQPRITIGRVADEREPIGDRCRPNTPFLEHAGLVIGDTAAPVAEDDPLADDA